MQRTCGETVCLRSWGEIDYLNFWGSFKDRSGAEVGG